MKKHLDTKTCVFGPKFEFFAFEYKRNTTVKLQNDIKKAQKHTKKTMDPPFNTHGEESGFGAEVQEELLASFQRRVSLAK